jgi:membrane protein implicated in regulation of membrane protease activity
VTGTTGVVFWVVLALVLFALETVTVAFIGIYLGVGALCAAVVAALDGALWLQLVVFAVVSAGTLYLTRPALRSRFVNAPLIPSNVPALVGRQGVVVIAIPAGTGGRGQVKVGTEDWSARSTDERSIEVGATVEVVAVEGVAVIVRVAGDAAAQNT